jgi:hypothetical protein
MGVGVIIFWLLLTNYKLKFKGFSNYKNLEIFFNKNKLTKCILLIEKIMIQSVQTSNKIEVIVHDILE